MSRKYHLISNFNSTSALNTKSIFMNLFCQFSFIYELLDKRYHTKQRKSAIKTRLQKRCGRKRWESKGHSSYLSARVPSNGKGILLPASTRGSGLWALRAWPGILYYSSTCQPLLLTLRKSVPALKSLFTSP